MRPGGGRARLVRLSVASALLLAGACGSGSVEATAAAGGGVPRAPLRWYHRPVPATRESLAVGPGDAMAYLRIQPEGCREPGACPVLIAVGGGAQTENLARESIRPWAQDLHDAGWLVLAPIAPGRDALFFEGGADRLAAFIEAAAARHLRPDETLVLFGVSNGGLSAFRVAPHVRERLARVVVAPGFARAEDHEQLERLAGLPVHLFIGADDDWLGPVRGTERALSAAGARTTLRVFDGAGHLLADVLTFRELRAALGDPR